jgi:hypothetical protein
MVTCLQTLSIFLLATYLMLRWNPSYFFEFFEKCKNISKNMHNTFFFHFIFDQVVKTRQKNNISS